MNGWTPINLSKKVVHSGFFSNKIDSTHIYGATFKEPFKEISEHKIVKVKVSFWAYLLPKSKGKLVLDVKNKKDSLVYWIGENLSDLIPKKGEWQQGGITFVIPGDSISKPDNIIGIYPWNVGKEEFYIDDFKLEFVVGN